MIDIQWAKEVEPYNKYRRFKIYYQRNGQDQNATVMEYTDGIFVVCEAEYYKGNKPTEKDRQTLCEYATKHLLFADKC